MEDMSFQYSSSGDEILWFDEFLPLPVVNNQYGSSFVKYSGQPLQGFGSKGYDQNANKRMMEFLKKSWNWKPPAIQPVEAERERNLKHVINERMRRVKQKQSFAELHKMLPLGTRGDKNSIVQMAAERIQELQRCREELKKRKFELEWALSASNHDDKEKFELEWALSASNHDDKEILEESKINLRVANPSSGIDSMLEVLKCLKNTGTKTKAIQSTFSSKEFSAVLQIETKIGAAAVVEKAVQKTLYEVEKKFRPPF